LLDNVPGLAEYTNLPITICATISSRMATLRELEEFYSVEDVYNMIEIASIDIFNRNVVDEYVRRKER
jgi:hypothetical protein